MLFEKELQFSAGTAASLSIQEFSDNYARLIPMLVDSLKFGIKVTAPGIILIFSADSGKNIFLFIATSPIGYFANCSFFVINTLITRISKAEITFL